MTKIWIVAVLLGGCTSSPLHARLDSPVSVLFNPGERDTYFTYFEDGPDDDLGVLESYSYGPADNQRVAVGYRRRSRKYGGSVYLFVQQQPQPPCEIEIPTPQEVMQFDSACGSGEIVVPHL